MEKDGFDYVGVDTKKGMYMAVKHLAMQGHVNIAYIAGVKELQAFKERYEGYRNALIDSGLPVNDELVVWKDYSESCGYEAGMMFLKMNQRPTAVCAANDMLALGAMRAFEDNGLKVPEDISIVGMDNIDIASRVKPKLSSVSIAQAEIGRIAADIIFKRLSSEEKGISKKIILEPRLVVRESSVLYR